VPEIASPISFESLILDNEQALRLLFSERDGEGFENSTRASGPITSVVALVGSEGGWSDEELEKAKTAGWQIVSLGGRILRAETAAIAVSVLIQHVFGDVK
jgi:16S rRNA (uracil1498-N3)-methyltransferase